MPTNYFFNSGIPENYTANQRLLEALIIESIQITGMDMFYIPRTHVDIDMVFTEDTLSKFTHAIPLEMYLESAQGFEGDGAMMSKFGIQIHDSCTFVVARKRLDEEIGNRNISSLKNRPVEGDIIYMPLTKSLFEIKRVVSANPFYQLGKLFVYRLECELFQYSSEKFETGNQQIDEFASLFSTAQEDDVLLTEDNFAILNEDGSQFFMDDIEEEFQGAQNNIFNDHIDVLDFSENNPFGEIIRK